MAFSGYLLKLISTSNVKTEIPLKYIRYSTYKVTPDQMLDLDTGLRDITGVMHRNVVAHTATKVEFETPSMTNTDVNALITLLMNHVRVARERDVYLEYYDVYTNGYKTGHFYIPDINFEIRNVDSTNNVINYNQVRIAFIEY